MGKTSLSPNEVYQFKITLLGTDPPIWRRIQVPDIYTFWDLHVAIQDSMGWQDQHLHQFQTKGWGRKRGVMISIPSVEDADWGLEVLPGYLTPISDHFSSRKREVLYLYDFGDNWGHLIELEDINKKEGRRRYPVCLDGKGACPPEDCGGIDGYFEALNVIAKTSLNEEDREFLEWLGDYEAERFDPGDVVFEDPDKRLRFSYPGIWEHLQVLRGDTKVTDEKKSKLKEIKDDLKTMTREFCIDHINEEYSLLCEKMIDKLSRKRKVPFLSGKRSSWAAGIVYSLGQINFLFDRSFEPYIEASEISSYFGVSSSTCTNKAKTIRDMLDIGYFDEEFSTERNLESNPLNDLVMLDNGLIVSKETLTEVILKELNESKGVDGVKIEGEESNIFSSKDVPPKRKKDQRSIFEFE